MRHLRVATIHFNIQNAHFQCSLEVRHLRVATIHFNIQNAHFQDETLMCGASPVYLQLNSLLCAQSLTQCLKRIEDDYTEIWHRYHVNEDGS